LEGEVMIDNWRMKLLTWLRQNEIKRIDTSVEPVSMDFFDGARHHCLPTSHTLKFFDKDDKCVYENIFDMPKSEAIFDIFKLYNLPTFVEVDEF
jgi:hypothetical protein